MDQIQPTICFCIEFYGNTGAPLQLCIAWGYFHATQSCSCNRLYGLPKESINQSFIEKVDSWKQSYKVTTVIPTRCQGHLLVKGGKLDSGLSEYKIYSLFRYFHSRGHRS